MKLWGKDVLFIAEVKTASPFGFRSKDSWEKLFRTAELYGDMISVHTDPRWEGSFGLLEKARKMTKKPLLAKGIHASDSEIEKAFDVGADYCLVVGRVPSGIAGAKLLIEPTSLKELETIPGDMKVVWNSRDIDSGGQKTETFEEARSEWKGWLCQASNVVTVADVKQGADAVLVGEHLLECIHSYKRLAKPQ